MTSIQLTAKQAALMAAIADRQFSFFDSGLEADSGIWQECMGAEIAGSTKYPVSDSVRGVATVATSLAKKGLLAIEAATGSIQDSEGAWTYLTEAGAAWCAAHNAAKVEALIEENAARQDAPVVEETYLELSETTAVVTEGDVETTTWETAGKEDTVYWTEIKFADASRTIKRRQKVSGAWRTDYYGAEFAGDAERLTTSAKVKAAIAAGSFTR